MGAMTRAKASWAACLLVLVDLTACGGHATSSVGMTTTAPVTTAAVPLTTTSLTTSTTQAATPRTTEVQAPLSPAALATALRTRPFPTANLGYGVSLEYAKPPDPPRNQWLVRWRAPAADASATLDLLLFPSYSANLAAWNLGVREAKRYDPGAVFEVPPSPAYCSDVEGQFLCTWIDSSVGLTCYGELAIDSDICTPLFDASQEDLQQVDPRGGF